MSSCYGQTPLNSGQNDLGKGSIGWCATRDPEAKIGQRGYCGPGETAREEEAPIIYPNSTNWGFCDPKCRYGSRDENMIKARVYFSQQEAYINISTRDKNILQT